MPLEPGPSEIGTTQQPQQNPPVASTSYLPPPPDPIDPALGYGTVAANVHGINYPDQLFQPPVMPPGDPHVQEAFMDPSFFALSDVSLSDLHPNSFVPPSSD